MATAICLHELVEQSCEHMGDAIAIVDRDTSISFAVLNNTANHLARALQRRSVACETLVGVYLDRSIHFIITVLAILKAGGAYIPLEPSLPSERLRQIIDESKISLVVAPAPLAQSIAGDVSCFTLNDWLASPGIEDETNLGHIALPDNLAYVIFTSGSTGVPKGVMGTHRGICNRLLWGKEAYQLKKQDILLQQTPVSFDPSIWEIFGGLISGGRIVISHPDGHKDPGYITQTIARYAVTIVDFVPALLRPFVQHSDSAHCQSLRCITCAGEALTEDLQYLVFQRFPQITLFHLYGPTEASIDVTFWKCHCQDHQGPIPLGHAIQGMYIVLLDEHFRPVDQGEVGEICLGGIGLARGYIHRPDLTAERFIPDMTRSAIGTRLYRTGDYGKMLPNGELVFLGRIDRQVKIRGVRVELGEIEAKLTSHPAIQTGAVTVRPDALGGTRLIAYLVMRAGQNTSETLAQVRAHMVKNLPITMVPSLFVVLNKLPLSHNGKINYQELPLPAATRPLLVHPYSPARTPTEATLVEIWQNVLGIEPIGIDDPFLDLGGHSLALIQIYTQMREKLLWDISLVDLFQYQTIRQVAKRQAPISSSQQRNQRAMARHSAWQRHAAQRAVTNRRDV